MHKKHRWMAILLAILMLAGSLSACSDGNTITDDSETSSETPSESASESESSGAGDTESEDYMITSNLILPAYTFAASQVERTYPINEETTQSTYGILNNPIIDGTNVTFRQGAVNGIYSRVSSSGEAPTTYSFYLKNGTWRSLEEGGWMTVYLGMRLINVADDATGRSGVWMAMRNNGIGIRTGDWPETTYAEVPVNFAKGAQITVVDDPSTNRITVYTGEGEDLTEIAHIDITETNIELYVGDETEPAVTDTIVTAIQKGGYAHLWSHCPEAQPVVKDFTMTLTRTEGDLDNDGIIPTDRDVLADTWVGVDGADRQISTVTLGTPNEKKVGIFYFIWHESNKNSMPLYDHTDAYLSGGMDGLWEEMTSGPEGFAHYWAEPYFGYYASDDEWVLRKHAEQLSAAGVDFVYLDASNGYLYEHNYMTLLKVWSEMRQEGQDTPQVAFLCGSSLDEFNSLWNQLYKPGLYEDLWFRWQGKPLIMFTFGLDLPEEAQDFFTQKVSWANTADSWYTSREGVDCWAWGDMFPQRPGYRLKNNKKKVLEQMVVMCGFWANGSYGTNGGRSYTRTKGIPSYTGDWDLGFALFNTTSGLGLGFQECFDYAIKKDPELIMVTGWNEWWAGRWDGEPAIGQTIGNGYVVSGDASKKEYNYYVDCLNPEYSRDIEPMKGGFTDNYYYQLVQNIRTYKGARNVESAFGQKTIDLNGSVGQWYAVGPEYRDNIADTAHRNHVSHVGGLTYTNDTGRNDFVTAKVSSDDTYLYFYVECAEDITAAEGENWMNLFIKADGDDSTGWNGFDLVLNRSRDGETVSVERFVDNGWSFETVGSAAYTLDGRVLQIRVEKSLLGVGSTFDFKWADNSVSDGDVMGFTDLGDTAPDGRFCYRFTTAASEQKTPEGLTSDMVVLKANGYNAYVNGAQIRLVDNNTKATAMASGYDVWLPVSFLSSALGVDAGDIETVNHYGVDYVHANELIEGTGKVITISSNGLIVIADAAIEDSDLLTTLYRALA